MPFVADFLTSRHICLPPPPQFSTLSNAAPPPKKAKPCLRHPGGKSEGVRRPGSTSLSSVRPTMRRSESVNLPQGAFNGSILLEEDASLLGDSRGC